MCQRSVVLDLIMDLWRLQATATLKTLTWPVHIKTGGQRFGRMLPIELPKAALPDTDLSILSELMMVTLVERRVSYAHVPIRTWLMDLDIDSRVARIKARVAELTGNMETTR